MDIENILTSSPETLEQKRDRKAKEQERLRRQRRDLAESSLEAFIKIVHPNRVLGHVHKELIQWWTRYDAKSHQLVLLPRDHQKSTMIAYRVAWEITKNPAIRVLYISATANLAIKQLKFIKDILTSDTYMELWPEMVNPEESKRTLWTASEISVDHPKRQDEMIRDPTVFTAGLTTTIVGLHCDIAVLDDVVIDETADTESGRDKVKTQVSYLASIASADSRTWVVGTRYHPKDLYNDMLQTTVEEYDEDGNVINEVALYEVFERQVEDAGDGSGNFLWPRQQTLQGKWFGFNREVLAKKKAGYFDIAKFRAQYYNNPNDYSTATITRDFQYYDPKLLDSRNGRWYYGNRLLNVFAAIDFAYSTTRTADYTAIAVIGIDKEHNIYVLDIERFRTKKISEYFDKILRLHSKWQFRKLRAEVTAAQDIIVEDLKTNYIRPYGLVMAIDPVRPTRNKEDRIEAALQPRYANKMIWHYRGGNCELLEEELILQRPPHDDLKDALASVVEIATPPSFMNLAHNRSDASNFVNKKFGGIG